MVKHSMSIEITASDPTEDGADETLDSIVAAVRARLSDGRPVRALSSSCRAHGGASAQTTKRP